MKPEQFIRDYGVEKAREVVEGAPDWAKSYYEPTGQYQDQKWADEISVGIEDLEHIVESLGRYSKFENKQEVLNAITNAPDGSTHYRKLSCGIRYIKQGPRFFEYWNGSEWCRPTVPFTDETHILRFDKLEDLKQSIKDHESIYGGGDA